MNTPDTILFPIAWCIYNFRRISRRVRERVMLSLFGSHGKRVRFHPDGYYTYNNIYLGNGVIIGAGAILMAGQSRIFLRDNVMIAPQATLIAGNHNTSVIGRAMVDVHKKRPCDDQDIVIQEDVWIGARATILKGVIVGRGAIIGAGALVSKAVPPYSVVGGNPARIIRFRWSVDQILEHEKKLYPSEQRILETTLTAARAAVTVRWDEKQSRQAFQAF